MLKGARTTSRGGASSAIACALAAGLCAWVFSGCSHSESADPSSNLAANQPATLRIGYQKSNALLNLLRVRQVLENRFGSRVNVVWQEFPAGPQLLEGLNVGSIDF
jgi:sulfonate transport system substrate-binding protein